MVEARLQSGDGRESTAQASPRRVALQALAGTLPWRIEQFFVPDQMLPDGSVDGRAVQRRYQRMVGVIAGVSALTFVPSMLLAGVPAHLWPAFVAGVGAAAVVISGSLLVVPTGTKAALLGAVVSALAIFGLDRLTGSYYHETPLLFPLVVAGQVIIQGFGAALVMGICGGLLMPLMSAASHGSNPTDTVYAFIYLLGVAAIVWTFTRLQERGAAAVFAGEAKYRDLVEHVPAVVYTAEAGAGGVWRYVSPRVEGLLGFPAESWTSDPRFWWSRVHPDDRARVLVSEGDAEILPLGQRSTTEYRLIGRDGEIRWVSDEAVVVRRDDGSRTLRSGFLTDITDRKALEQQLQHQAFHDPLTGLANRALLADRVEHALSRADRRRNSLALLYLDLDDFKTINDGMGHAAGDSLLVAVAQAIRTCLRPMDTAARLGGDEFAVLIEDLPNADAALVVADRIQAAVGRPFEIRGREVPTSVSIGIARPSSRRDHAAQLLRNADSAMYVAKRQGKGRCVLYEPTMHTAALHRLELITEIRRGLELGEFAVYYQPVMRLCDGSISGFEALVRWNHPGRGLVLPAEFIPTAEETGQIVELGGMVLGEACRQARAWRDAFPREPGCSMSVNVSARQFHDTSLGRIVAAAIAAAELDPASLILEITESTVMEDSEAALQRLHELKALGIRLAIDDFGTGYSSLSYLRRLPVDILKVDKSFIDGIAVNSDALALTGAIIRIGKTLRLSVVAEGVEHAAQAATLLAIGCDEAQGYHYAHPMPASEIGLLLHLADARRLVG